jgi:Uma2 family endonuclease
MLMATKTRRWTSADLALLPDDGNRYEVLDGELFVTPQAAYGHQHVAFAIARALFEYCQPRGIGEVVGPGAVVWAKNELQPDVQVIPGRHAPGLKTKWRDLPRPILVVEVLSDSTRLRDHGKKRSAYTRLKIPTYWTVDIDERSVDVWTDAGAEPTVVTDVLRWAPRPDLPPLEIRLADIFGDA